MVVLEKEVLWDQISFASLLVIPIQTPYYGNYYFLDSGRVENNKGSTVPSLVTEPVTGSEAGHDLRNYAVIMQNLKALTTLFPF